MNFAEFCEVCSDRVRTPKERAEHDHRHANQGAFWLDEPLSCSPNCRICNGGERP